MKKIIERMRLNEFIAYVKKWVKRKKGDDDDLFDHPFAIF
jgi:hypothetical protein